MPNRLTARAFGLAALALALSLPIQALADCHPPGPPPEGPKDQTPPWPADVPQSCYLVQGAPPQECGTEGVRAEIKAWRGKAEAITNLSNVYGSQLKRWRQLVEAYVACVNTGEDPR